MAFCAEACPRGLEGALGGSERLHFGDSEGVKIVHTESMKERMTTSLDAGLLDRLDELVGRGVCESRSAAVERGVWLLLASDRRARFEKALEAFDDPAVVADNQAEAEEGFEDWALLLAGDR